MNSILLSCSGEVDRGGLAIGRQFGCSEAAVLAASGGDLAQETALTAAVWAEYPPLGIESMQSASASRIDGGGLLGCDDSIGAKSAWGRSYL
jgi:hypothetical protein